MPTTHARAIILSIGDELVLGQSLDSNSKWLSEQFLARGVRPVRHTTIEDDRDTIAAELTRAAAEADLVITTGGLGPTADDLTRAALAKAMGTDLETDPDAMAQVEGWYASRGRTMPEANRVQGLRPAGAISLENTNGTAPGMSAELTNADIYCLPGPPREMRPMFERFIVPDLRPASPAKTRLLRTFGLGESRVAELLGDLMDRARNPLVGTTAQAGVVTVRMRWEGQGGGPELELTEREVRTRLGAAVVTPVGGDGEHGLADVVVALLRERGERLAVVESCTGGLVGQKVTAVAGSSSAFCGGWVTYTNAMKAGQVGVPEGYFPEVREGAPGAVSGEVAQAMAVGGMQRAAWEIGAAPGVDHCLAVTGIAGPDGGTAEKPVGTVWICRASRDGTVDCRRFVFGGGREAVREWSAAAALGMLRLKLAGVDMELLGEGERRGV